ncbi:MAG: FtsX-like permease family protein [Alphaproteobacteria bacterium]|nr:FtsX-like permease family protein [Alphaproteobacteria bacterium]
MRSTSARYAVRLAFRELRGGIRGLRVFLACIVLGVTAIAAIGSLAACVTAGIKADARDLLGGDVEARLAYRPADGAEREFLAHSGTMSEILTMRAMARTPDGAKRSLIDLKAVDSAYPLYGTVSVSPAQTLARALGRRDGRFGALVDPAILGRLGLKTGDNVKIGKAVLQLRGTIEREPDAATGGLIFGPRVLISAGALAETGLIQPGALVSYHYRLRLPPGTDPARWAAGARAAFPKAGWQIRSFGDASPSLERLIERVALYLSLVGLTALLVGGVGISSAVGAYIAGKTATIATLKCLGSSTRLIFAAYLVEILVLAVFGIVTALLLGAVTPVLASPLLASVLPVSLRLAVYPAPLALAALFGLLTTLVFALWPLAGIGRVPPGALFRDAVDRTPRRIPAASSGAILLLALGLAGLAVASAQDRTVALWFVAAAIATFTLFRVAGMAAVLMARRVPRPRHPMLRLALANLHRPGAPTGQIVLSLGIGLTVLVAVVLVEGNLAKEIDTRLPAEAPAFYFIDIQPNQLSGFAEIVHTIPQARFDQVPMMRGRITRLNGVPVEQATVSPQTQWALRSDRGLTYAADLPAGSRLAAGTWWPPDYRGPPLVSFDAALAQGMGLKVGDTLSVNLLGREITAVIANLRSIDWKRLGINFAIVFAPGTLERAPHTHLAAVYVPPAEEENLERAVSERFPNVSAIHVREALGAVDRVIRMIGNAMRLTALVTLAAGILVLGGALAAGHHRRVYDAVVLKVLGATRGAITRAFLIEYGVLGALAASLAGVLGTVAAHLLVTRLMKLEWVFLALPLFGTIVSATLLTLVLGVAGTWRALSAEPALHLREE